MNRDEIAGGTITFAALRDLQAKNNIYQPQPDSTFEGRETLKTVQNRELAKHAEAILDSFRAAVPKIDLPNIYVFEDDEGALVVSWMFDDFRIGINLELDAKESGWYLVCNERAGNISTHGKLKNVNIDKLVSWLVCFVENNL